MTTATGRRTVLVQVNHLELGGSQLNAVDLAARVRDHGYDCVLVGPADSRPEDGPSLFEVAADRGVHLEAVPRPRTTREGAVQLTRTAERFGADVVHVYGSWSIRSAYWGPCRLARRPLVMTVYEMEVDPIVYRAASLVVGTGYLADEQAGRPGPVSLVSPPVDLLRDDVATVPVDDFLAGHRLDPSHRRVVIVSRLDGEPLRPVKTTAVEAAIGAIERLGDDVDDPVDLVVVGTGLEEVRLRQLGDALNDRLGRRACTFTGALADPRPAYACADIVLGMGGSAARGLAFGKPLIVTGEYGTFQTFTPHEAAAIFRTSFWSEERRPDPTTELRRELAPLLRDRDRQVELGAFGRRFAEDNYGLDAMAKRLASVYDDAVDRYSPVAWALDLGLEARWAASWAGRRVRPSSRVSRRLRSWSDGVTDRTGGYVAPRRGTTSLDTAPVPRVVRATDEGPS